MLIYREMRLNDVARVFIETAQETTIIGIAVSISALYIPPLTALLKINYIAGFVTWLHNLLMGESKQGEAKVQNVAEQKSTFNTEREVD